MESNQAAEMVIQDQIHHLHYLGFKEESNSKGNEHSPLSSSNMSKNSQYSLKECTIKCEKQLKGDELAKKELDVASRKVSVFNIRGTYNEAQFTELFLRFGEIEVAYFNEYKDKKNKFHGFVTFKNQQSAQIALQTGSFVFNDYIVKIKKFNLNSKKFQML